MKFIVVLFIVFILASLFSALYFVLKDQGRSQRAVRALTVRITLSLVLFVLLMLAFRFGFISGRL